MGSMNWTRLVRSGPDDFPDDAVVQVRLVLQKLKHLGVDVVGVVARNVDLDRLVPVVLVAGRGRSIEIGSI